MPLAAVLPAAADVGDHVGAAGVEPHAARGAEEERRVADPVAAVAVEQHRVGAVQLRSLAADDVQGDAGAVLRRREHAQHFHVVEVDRARHLERGRHALAVGEPVELQRRHVGLDAVEQVVADRLDLVHGRDAGQWHVTLRRARQIEYAHARRPAREITDIHASAEEHERILAAELARDHVFALRHERRRALEVERSGSESPDLAARRTGGLGDEVQGAVRPEARIGHAVLEAGHLHEATVLAAHVVRELAAVALLHGHQQRTGLVGIVEPDLGDLRQAIPEDLHVVLLVLAQAMEPDRLVEVLLIGRPVRTRIARVPESLAIRRPRDVAAGGRVLHARDRLADLPAGCHVEDIEAAVLAASLRQRHRDSFDRPATARTSRTRCRPSDRACWGRARHGPSSGRRPAPSRRSSAAGTSGPSTPQTAGRPSASRPT